MNRLIKTWSLISTWLCVSTTLSFAAAPTWISSTAKSQWETKTTSIKSSNEIPQVLIWTDKPEQSIDGFGGCFNELEWIALNKIAENDRAQVFKDLFSKEGCNFNLGRIPIGASDFATDAYSLDDTPGDFELKNFSIERDKKTLIPMIKEAMKTRPDLKCWASPWSPPAWMKTNKHYSGGELKWDKQILQTYANYFVKYVQAYRAEGVNLYGIVPQNEPNIVNVYPTCIWTADHLREFIGDYLGPAMEANKVDIQLWLGINGDAPYGGDNFNDRVVTVMEDPKANHYIAGFGFQYDSQNQASLAHKLYPEKKLMQSETVCYNGANSWDEAMQLYQLMKRHLNAGANAYFMWNMVLDEVSTSTWNWKQNSMITADTKTGKLTYNGEYYVMRHFSQFIQPGAKRVITTGIWGDKIAFVNPDGSIVLIIANSQDRDFDAVIKSTGKAGQKAIKISVPAKSVNTIVW